MLETAERLIISEIGDFTSGLGHPGEPETPDQIHAELMARVQRVFADVKQQISTALKQQDCLAEIKAQAVEDAIKSVQFKSEGKNCFPYCYSHSLYDYATQLRQQSKAGIE